MSIRNDLFLARVLNTELKYQFLKNTSRFQGSDKQSTANARKYLINNTRTSIYINTFFYGVISVVFGSEITQGTLPLSTGSFTLFLFLVILTIMTDSQFYRGIWDMKLLRPLTQLPLKLERRVIPFSLFVYNEIYLPFVTLPAGILISVWLGSPLPFLLYLIFTILFLYIGRTISLVLGVGFVKTNTNRKTKRLYLGQILQVLIFVLFILAIQIATNPAFISYLKIPPVVFLFVPVTYQYATMLNYYPFLVFAITFSPLYLLYMYLQKRNFSDKMEAFSDVPSKGSSENSIISKSPVKTLVDKDFKMIMRRRGAIMIMVIPIAFILPIIPGLLAPSTADSAGVSISIPILSSVFLIDFILLIGLEGRAAWHLSALPLTRRQFFLSKFLGILMIGMVYYGVITLIVAVMNKQMLSYMIINLPFFTMILLAVLTAGGTYIVKSIPNEVYTLSQEGIGGRWMFVKTFGIGLPIIMVNALLFYLSSHLTLFHLSYYAKGYLFTVVLDLVISLLFVRFFLKKGEYF